MSLCLELLHGQNKTFYNFTLTFENCLFFHSFLIFYRPNNLLRRLFDNENNVSCNLNHDVSIRAEDLFHTSKTVDSCRVLLNNVYTVYKVAVYLLSKAVHLSDHFSLQNSAHSFFTFNTWCLEDLLKQCGLQFHQVLADFRAAINMIILLDCLLSK